LVEVTDNGNETAKYYTIAGYNGRIGFISPMSHKFCNRCNRIRLTCDGKIKPCLGDNTEIDIATVLRNQPEKLEWFIKKAFFRKPAGHQFDCHFVSKRSMTAIGG
jgi:cyclic pyranopterin phosphate synthase